MEFDNLSLPDPAALRARAEELYLLQHDALTAPPTGAALKELLRDLGVRLIALQLENEHLRKQQRETADALMRNRTEELDAQKILRESEERFRHIFENSPLGKSITGLDRSLRVNGAFCVMIGYTEEELHEKDWKEITHPDDIEKSKAYADALFAGTYESVKFEKRYIHKNGDIIWTEITTSLQRNAEGAPEYFITTMNNINDRVAVETALRESQALYHSFVEHMPAGVFRKDAQGRYIFVNTIFCRLKGLRPEEILGKTPRELSAYETSVESTRPAELMLCQRTLAEAGEDHHALIMRTGKPIEVEEVYAGPDGSSQYFHVVKSPVFSSDGIVIGSQGIQFDVTELKTLEHQLMQAQKLEGIGTLAGGIAHEFNNLLAMILGSAEMLKMNLGELPKLRKFADRIIDASVRGTSISRQLLIFSRPDQAELKHLSLAHTITEVRELLSHFLPRSIELHTFVDPDNATIIGDAGQIHQAILNLALNAGDAMPGGGTLIIKHAVAEQELIHQKFGYAGDARFVALSVSDTGTGIDAPTLEKIFHPFFSTKEKGKGTGLGLSIVHGIVKHHHGFIDVESIPGQGTVFTMYFPSVPTAHADRLTHADSITLHASDTILFVDDEAMIRDLYAEYLADSGYNTIAAANGHEALEVFRQHSDTIRIVITDLGMPQMGGEELLRRLREIDPAVCVIASSGYLEGTSKDDLRALGFKGILTKPFKLHDIIAAIDDILTQRG